MKKIYLPIVFITLQFAINSCKEDEEVQETITTDISVTSSESLIFWLDNDDLTQKLNDALTFNYGNALESEVEKIITFNADSTQVVATIGFKQDFQNKYYDSNTSNNLRTIELQQITEGTGLLEYPSNYNTFPSAQFPTTGVLDPEFELDMPPSRNQGSQGSCTAWAVGYGMQSFFRKNEFNLNYETNGNLNFNSVCSPSYIYNQIKVSDCFSGSHISHALDLLLDEGVCSLLDMNYYVNDCDLMPNQQQINSAQQNKITEWNTVYINTQQIKLALSNNHPVVIAAHLYEGFFKPSNINDQDVWNVVSGNSNGYHAMVIYGWNDSLNSFNVLNSWGSDFGNDGSIWIDYDLFDGVVIDQAYIAFNEQSQGNSIISLSGDINFENVQINTSSTQTLTILNTGNESFNITEITSSNSVFSIVNGQSTTIQPDGYINVQIQFTPTQEQTYNGVITVDSTADNANGSNSSIQVTGTGVNSSSSTISISGDLNFPDTEIGATSQQTLTISNTGNESFNITEITSSNSAFSIVNGQSTTIQPDGYINVQIQFTPTQEQTYNGVITVDSTADNANGSNSSIQVTGTGVNYSSSTISISGDLNFPDTEIGATSQQTLTISNTGNESFNITEITSSNSVFSIVNGQSTTIQPDGYINVQIQFTPTQEQTYNGVITVDSTADNANGSNSSIQVTGTGVNYSSSTISISGDLNFPDTEIGTTSQRTFTVSNTGDQIFNVSSISFPSGVYSTNWNSGNINAGSSQNVIVTFQPTNVQSYSGTVTVNHNADGGNGTLSINGNGINNNTGQPNLRFYDFDIQNDNNNNGIIEAGEDIDFDIRLENYGNATATNIEAIISTTDPDITISDNDRTYDDMPQGDLEWNSGSFDFQVSSSHPTSTVVFSIQINSSEGTWNDTFTINVQGSNNGDPQVDVGNSTPRDNCSDTDFSDDYKLHLNTIYYKQNWNINNIISYGSDGNRGMWYRFETTNYGSYTIVVGFNANADAGFQLFSSCTSSRPIVTVNSSSSNTEGAEIILNGNTEYFIRFYDINDSNPVTFAIIIRK
ncbi:choice-of-anchor D domain-containing protein [Muricauda sp. SCSIO 64092]|uniref:choice-of-anchor D domain-containing protein n=1 Tax=Allomuricauda sp. SCSIO 64092 TaxID=2908842 RepID=UPI001FF41E16|nr:choice-of-anchor D domain-containing protein [Muricauda sp. SCSIO 64092]UOY09217.1 choice-of-anchor D domain-containing protein [Muricauda sp. SCSIO 64092]